MKLYENEQQTNKSSMSIGGVDAEQREKIREITEKSDNAIIVASMGLSLRALIYGTCITLFLLVLLNLG